MAETVSPRVRRVQRVVTACLVLVLLVVAGFVVFRGRTEQPEPTARFVQLDTAGRATGQAQKYTEALRRRGLVCSDRYLDYTPVLVRGCYRKDATHEVMADFAATPEGTLSWASVQVDYLKASDEAAADTDLEAIAGDFAQAAGAAGLAGFVRKDGRHRTGWGTVTADGADVDGIGSITALRDGWTWPDLPAERLTGTADQIGKLAADRGFDCTSDATPARVTTCTKQAGGAIKVIARSDSETLNSFGVEVEATADAHTRALDELRSVLGQLDGGRAAQVKQWFDTTGQVSGARAHVAGIQVCQVTDGATVNLEVTTFRPYDRWTGDC